MDKKTTFLYLNQKDMITAGVNDMRRCIDVMDDMFQLLSNGDYIMGSRNCNSHGVMLTFPDHPLFPNMPKNGPDRRFMAMPAYLGGNFDVVGMKWYGSNKDNCNKGLPRSILVNMLNDKDTGAPIALQSANLLSSMRTGAIPGVGAKYLARKDSKVLGVIGPGVVSRSSCMAIIEACPTIDTVKICGRRRITSENLGEFLLAYNTQIKNIVIVDSMEEAVRGSDIMCIATSGAAEDPYIKEEWIKPGALFCLPASIHFDDIFLTGNRVSHVVDNWKMYESWREEYDYPYYKAVDELACYYLDMIHDNKLSEDRIINLGDIILGKQKAREKEDDIVLFTSGGMPVEDVAWGYTIYKQALERGIGVELELWG